MAVRAYFTSEEGRLYAKAFTAPARSRLTLNLGAEIGPGSYSAVFQSQTAGGDISVERSMYFGPNFEVSTGERAVHFTNTQWIFAEGSRGGELFDNFYLLFNPNAVAVNVDLYFKRADGVTVRYQYQVLPLQRLTINAGLIPELAGKDFSAIMFSTVGIVAERSMYWRPVGTPVGTPWVGGHTALGSPGASRNWYFAEGAAAPGFDTFYLFVNPYNYALIVHSDFLTETHGHIYRTYLVPANSRQTVYLNQELGMVGSTAVKFSSETPFVAERSIYWGSGRVDGTSTAGVVNTAGFWSLPEGVAGGQFDTYLILANPSAFTSVVDISLQIEGYGQVTLPPALRKTVPAYGRLTLHMGQLLREVEQSEGMPPGSLASTSFATSVRVFTGGGIVVEHAIYRQRAGSDYWRAGSAAFGSPADRACHCPRAPCAGPIDSGRPPRRRPGHGPGRGHRSRPAGGGRPDAAARSGGAAPAGPRRSRPRHHRRMPPMPPSARPAPGGPPSNAATPPRPSSWSIPSWPNHRGTRRRPR